MSTATLEVMRTIEKLDDNSVKALYNWLSTRVQLSWGDIAEEDPDELDMKMLARADADPDCQTFIAEDNLFLS